RAGDEEAAAELVRLYEPAVRRTIRLQMRDPRLRRALDSVDICQSVLCSFFVRAALGQYDLQQPQDLCRLLAAMARNKVISQARRPHVTRRDPQAPSGEEGHDIPGAEPDPSRQAEARD